VESLLNTEPGGHRWQRIPKNDKHGRLQTSTVTVAALSEQEQVSTTLDMKEVSIDIYRAPGAGGQHKNKVETAVRARHIPTGIVARSESERSQGQNKAIALEMLAARVAKEKRDAVTHERAQERRQQVGSGERGDKIRTIRTQDGIVTCERTGKKHRLKDYLRGDLEWLTSKGE
jgi:peptide chain release factor 1